MKNALIPPKHSVKQRILQEYAATYGLRIFVETGTYMGDMVEAMRHCCEHIYSIELSEMLYRKCLSRFHGIPCIELIHGDSGVELGKLIKRIRQPALFWLDGHYSGGITARGTKDTPIWEELAHILSATEMGHVIIVDDARCFGTDEGYPAISELCQYIQSKRPNTKIDIEDDMIRITPVIKQSGVAKSSDGIRGEAANSRDRTIEGTKPTESLQRWRADRGDQTLRLNYKLDEHSVVFDLGGYRGQWASDIFERYKCNTLIFEPVKKFANQISERFQNNTKISINPFGLGAATRIETIGVCEDSSSIFRKQGDKETIQIVDIAEWLNTHNISQIDLMKINIEGGEYELLERLIETNLITRIKDIQVQFHDLLPDSSERMSRIHKQLSLTHSPSYQYRFVWENWTRIEVLPERCDDAQPVISMSTLGHYGRFGNQLFQYLFLRIYAQKYNLAVHTPAWIGQKLFGYTEPAVTGAFPVVYVPYSLVPFWLDPKMRDKMPLVNVDFKGYFQYHTKYYTEHKTFIRALFRPMPQVESVVRIGLDRLRNKGKTLVGIHLRRGDFGHLHHYIAPTEWYKQWLDGFWQTLEEPVLFIASDEPEIVTGDFAEYNPVTCADLGVDFPAAPFYPDFYILSHCDAVATSNSTFSFLACMLNEKATIFMRPRLSCRKLIPFDPWNSVSNFTDETVEQIVAAGPACRMPAVNNPEQPAAPAVSVIMAAFNAERFIGEAMESVLAQRFGEFELLVVDDGSTDNTVSIVQSYKDARIRLIRQPHKNFAAAMNRGIQEACGEFVMTVDSDDRIEPDYLRKMTDAARACPGFAYYYPEIFTLMDEQGRIGDTPWRYHNFENPDALAEFLFIHGFSPIPNPGSLRRREMFSRLGGYREIETVEDFDFLTRNALQIRFKRADGVSGYLYRIRPDSISRKMTPRNTITADAMEAMLTRYSPEILCPSLKTIAPEQRQAAFIRYVITVFSAHAKRHAGRGGEFYVQAARRIQRQWVADHAQTPCQVVQPMSVSSK